MAPHTQPTKSHLLYIWELKQEGRVFPCSTSAGNICASDSNVMPPRARPQVAMAVLQVLRVTNTFLWVDEFTYMELWIMRINCFSCWESQYWLALWKSQTPQKRAFQKHLQRFFTRRLGIPGLRQIQPARHLFPLFARHGDRYWS